MSEKCSEAFQDAFTEGGTLVATCELCGRTHFATNDPHHFDEGELEDLQRKQKAEPEKYHEHDCSGLAIGRLYGRQMVWGCACGWEKLKATEEFLLEHRDEIVSFYKKAAEEEQRAAQQSARVLQGL